MSDLRKSIWIDAPPEVVFAYFIDPDKVARWSGVQAELNPIPGGTYRLDMGVAGIVEGRFVKIEPGRFVSWTVNAPEGVEVPPSTIEITLTAEAGGSRVDVRQIGLAAPFDLMASRGWDHHLARLSVAAQGGSPGTDRLCNRPMESLIESRMSDKDNAEALARVWIHRWNEGAPDRIPLAEDFKHTSPFGCVAGRKKYLDWVKPLAAKNVTELKILRTLSSSNSAAIHFAMQTPKGLIQVCDWIVTKDGEITEIHSFYDATELRDRL